MATLDLDPVFVKALRLLHSKSKDSALQLRAMLDESITARKAQKVCHLLSQYVPVLLICKKSFCFNLILFIKYYQKDFSSLNKDGKPSFVLVYARNCEWHL